MINLNDPGVPGESTPALQGETTVGTPIAFDFGDTQIETQDKEKTKKVVTLKFRLPIPDVTLNDVFAVMQDGALLLHIVMLERNASDPDKGKIGSSIMYPMELIFSIRVDYVPLENSSGQ